MNMTREEQIERLNTIRIFRDLVDSAIRSVGLHPKDSIKHGAVNIEGLPEDKRPTSFYTLQNDLSYYLSSLRNARAALRPVNEISITNRHDIRSREKAGTVFDARYKKRSETPTVLSSRQFDERLSKAAFGGEGISAMKDRGQDPTLAWDTVDDRKLVVPTTHSKHMTEMGLDDWVKVGGRDMMFIRCIERKRPAWAEEVGVQVRKAVMMETARIKTGYRSYEDVFRYHNNVWLLTMKTHDGAVIAAANKSWGRARSLMDQYIKSNVMDQLEGL